MGLLTLMRRRLGTHFLAFVAVLVTVLMSMVVVATLQLLSTAISDAGVRSTLSAATSGTDRAERTVRVSASVKRGSLDEADELVRQRLDALGPDLVVSRVTYPTVRGIKGADTLARAQLADVEGLKEAVDLVSGTWPTAPPTGAPSRTLDVAMPEATAKELGLDLGKSVELPSLTNPDEPALTVTLVGTYRVRDFTAAIWLDDDLSPTGVRKADYLTYGPMLLAPGVFDSGVVGASTVTWRGAARFDEATPGSIERTRETFVTGLAALRETVGDTRTAPSGSSGTASPLFSSGRVDSALPDHLDAATLVSERIRASLLTPVVLLILLGASSLVMAARLLVGLRADETRLMRTRGMSARQLTTLALADSAVVVVPGVIGALLLAPLLTGALGRGAGVPLGAASFGSALRDRGMWIALTTMAVLTIVVIVVTALRAGLTGVGLGNQAARAGANSRVPAMLQVLSGAGLDLALVGLGVLAVLQLRRYDAAGSTTVDPLTVAAPACIIAGLAVLCLRLLPVAARQTERVSVGHVGLDRAWGAWQLSRRLAAQGGTILLILLCVAMGAMAVSHSATADRAIVDQSAFETGAPIRVASPVGRGLAEDAAGDKARAMPVFRDVTDLRTTTGVTMLGVDATRAGSVVTPRTDTLRGASWPGLMESLAEERPDVTALTLPADARELTFDIALTKSTPTSTPSFVEDVPAAGQVLVRDAEGLLATFPAGNVTPTKSEVKIQLPTGGEAMAAPLSVLAFRASLPEWLADPSFGLDALDLQVTDLRADGRAVAGLDQLKDQSVGVLFAVGTEPPVVKQLPVVMTQQLAASLDTSVGAVLTIDIAGRPLPVRVVGLVDSVVTATEPQQALVFDLPTLAVTNERPGVDKSWPLATSVPREWWLAPTDPAAAAATLRDAGVPSDVTSVRSEVESARRANPVNAGMQAAMLLVTGAALVLAAVGFAATTASLARARHHENAILLALGMPPARIRRVLTVERLSVVVLTVLVGVAMGVVAAYLVVPFLVGGDGHDQVPPVVIVIPWWRLLALAGAVTALLAVIGVFVLRRTGSDVAAELRMGEAR